MNLKANLSGANFTGDIGAPVVDALDIRDNGININTIYETKFDATASSNAQNIRTDVLQSMLQEGPVFIDGVLQTSVNTTINMNHQVVVRSSTRFPMLASPTQITMTVHYISILLLVHRVSSKAPQVEAVEHKD